MTGSDVLAPVPARGVPGVRTLARVTRYVTVARPMSGVLAWLRAHPPGRLARDGSATADDRAGSARGAPATAGRRTRPRPPRSWRCWWRPAGARGAVRVDGLGIWLDPNPRPDRATGPRLHVDVAAGCPAGDRDVGVRNVNAPRTRLLPAGTPDGGLISQYNGSNGAALALLAARRLDAQQAARLATAVTALPLAHPDGQTRSCPADDGPAVVLALSSPHRPDFDLWLRRNGCRVIAIGAITAAAGLVPDQLAAAGR